MGSGGGVVVVARFVSCLASPYAGCHCGEPRPHEGDVRLRHSYEHVHHNRVECLPHEDDVRLRHSQEYVHHNRVERLQHEDDVLLPHEYIDYPRVERRPHEGDVRLRRLHECVHHNRAERLLHEGNVRWQLNLYAEECCLGRLRGGHVHLRPLYFLARAPAVGLSGGDVVCVERCHGKWCCAPH